MAEERSNDRVWQQNPRMITYDWEYYKHLLPMITGKVLDVGCGAGMFIKEYSKKDEVTSVLGVDKFSGEFPELYKVKYKEQRLPGKLPRGKFDTIVSTEFIEHIERHELDELLAEIVKHMHKDSLFVGSTPNKVAPTTNPFHLYEYTLTELVSIFKQYFSEVEAWDNGQNCTVWKAKL